MENKFKTKEVYSMNKGHLIFGIIMGVFTVLFEFLLIAGFIKSNEDIVSKTFFLIFMQLIVLICLALAYVFIKGWFHRKKFKIYYCDVKNGIDIDFIKKHYYIHIMNEEYVIFTKKNEAKYFLHWELGSFKSVESLFIELEEELDG